MQGKEKKHKHSLLFFSMPLDDHGNLKGYNQGKEKKRLHDKSFYLPVQTKDKISIHKKQNNFVFYVS